MILKVSGKVIAPTSADVTLGRGGGSYYVKIRGIPSVLSTPQVIVLFANTVKHFLDNGLRYEYDFSELCPMGMSTERDLLDDVNSRFRDE